MFPIVYLTNQIYHYYNHKNILKYMRGIQHIYIQFQNNKEFHNQMLNNN